MKVSEALLEGEVDNIRSLKYDEFIIGRRPISPSWGIFARDAQDSK